MKIKCEDCVLKCKDPKVNYGWLDPHIENVFFPTKLVVISTAPRRSPTRTGQVVIEFAAFFAVCKMIFDQGVILLLLDFVFTLIYYYQFGSSTLGDIIKRT